MNFMREDIAAHWTDANMLDKAFALNGKIYRDVPGRRTMRVEFGGKGYFVKLHYGVGWREVCKNWLQFKWPVIGAANEFYACRSLAKVGISAPLPAAFGMSTGNIAARRSFILSDELAGYTSLEDLTDDWPDQSPSSQTRHRMLYAVAQFAKTFHAHGFIHRDFYICHLLAHDLRHAKGEIALAVLDLHRARRFKTIPKRWLKRDLAALLFSTLDLGYTRRDWLRFIRIYTGLPLRQALTEQSGLWCAVLKRAEKLYDEGLRKGIVKGIHRT